MIKKFLNDGRDFRFQEKVRSILDPRQLFFKKIYYVAYYTGMCWRDIKSNTLKILRAIDQKKETERSAQKVLYTYFQILFSIAGFIISCLILSLKSKSEFIANAKIKAEISVAANATATCSLFIYILYHCVKVHNFLRFNASYIILVSDQCWI